MENRIVKKLILVLTAGMMLMVFSGNVFAADKVEGSGFDTQFEAVEAYVNGLIHQDVEEMLKACAVESYVDGFDLTANVENLQVLTPMIDGFMLPPASDFSRQLNLESRRNLLVKMIQRQYLVLNRSKMVLGEDVGKTIMLKDYDSAEALISEFLPVDDSQVMEGLEFKGSIIPNIILSDAFYSFRTQRNMQRQARMYGAEKQSCAAALLYVKGDPFLLTLGTIRYDGKWYISHNSVIGMMLNLDSLSGGLMPLALEGEASPELVQTIEDALSSEQMDTVIQLTRDLESMDIDPLLDLPEDQQEEAYEKEVEKVTAPYEEQIKELEDFVANFR